jgi:hypothetical protein
MNWKVLLLGVFATAATSACPVNMNELYYDLNTTFSIRAVRNLESVCNTDAHYYCPTSHECPNNGILWCKQELGNWSCSTSHGFPMDRIVDEVEVYCHEPYPNWIFTPTCKIYYSTRSKSGMPAGPIHEDKIPEFKSTASDVFLIAAVGLLTFVVVAALCTAVDEPIRSNPERSRPKEHKKRTVQDEKADPDSINDGCVICVENKRIYAAVPCGHTLCCNACQAKIANGKCPFCRAKIERLFRYYNS